MQVRIENFQSISEADLELKPFTVIVGPSDSGKSAIIRAINALFYNTPGSYYVKFGTKECSINLNDGENNIVFERGSSSKYEINGEKFSAIGRGSFENLGKLGYRELDADGTKVRPQVGMQIDAPYLISPEYTPTVVASVLGNLSDAAVVNAAKRMVEKDIKKLASKVRHLEDDLGDQKRKQVNEKELFNLLNLVKEIDAAQVKYTQLKSREESLIRLKLVISTSSKEVKMLSETLKHIREMSLEIKKQEKMAEVLIIRKAIALLNDLLRFLKGIYNSLTHLFSEAQKKRSDYESLIKLKKSYNLIQEDLLVARQSLKALELEKANVSLQLKEIKVCQTCGRPV